MSFRFVSTNPFMFWSTAQLILLLHVCLGSEGTIEESIRTKRVKSYLKNPKSGGHHSDYERKKIVETFHRIVKKILPPYLVANGSDSEGSSTDLKRREIEIPKPFDFDVGDNVLSESGGYSVKVLEDDPSAKTGSNARSEPFYDGVLTDDGLRKKKVSKRSPPSEQRSESPRSSPVEDRYRKMRKMWKRMVEEIIGEKKTHKSTLLMDSLNRRIRKRKWITDDDDSDDDETQIDDADRLKLLSMLSFLPVDTSFSDENDDGLQTLVLCVFGALSILGIALLIMGIYSATLTHVRGGAMALAYLENFKRACLGIIKRIPGLGSIPIEKAIGSGENYLKESERPSKRALKKAKAPVLKSPLKDQKGAERTLEEERKEEETPKRNPENVHFLLHTFVKVLNKRPSKSLKQIYESKPHMKAVRRIIKNREDSQNKEDSSDFNQISSFLGSSILD